MEYRVVLLLLFLAREWHVAEADCRKQLCSNSAGVQFIDCGGHGGPGEKPRTGTTDCTPITCAQGYVFEGKEDEWFDAPDDVEYIAIVGIDIPKGVTVTIHHIVDFENKCKILKLTSKATGREKIIIKLQPPHRKFKISATKPTATIRFICNKVRECTKMNEENARMKRIVRGKAADKNEYPFMAWILTLWSKTKDNYTECNEDNETDVNKIFKKCNNNVNGTKGVCGGSIINNRWVLSAAHCFIKPGKHLIGVLVFLGDHLIKEKDGEKVYWVSTKATDLITHPDYLKDTYSDIALLQVDRNIDLDKEKCYPICLAPLNMDDLVGCKVHTAGWGQTEVKQLSDELRKEKDGPFEIFENAVCRDKRPDHIICFKHEETNACSGDSGGPLFCDSANDFYYEVGVLESVMNATEGNAADIWEKGGRQQAVKVTSFLKWINDNAGYLP